MSPNKIKTFADKVGYSLEEDDKELIHFLKMFTIECSNVYNRNMTYNRPVLPTEFFDALMQNFGFSESKDE